MQPLNFKAVYGTTQEYIKQCFAKAESVGQLERAVEYSLLLERQTWEWIKCQALFIVAIAFWNTFPLRVYIAPTQLTFW